MTGPRLKINPKPLRLPDAGVSRPSLPKPGGAEPAPPDPAPVEAAPFSDYGTLLTAQLPEELRAPPPEGSTYEFLTGRPLPPTAEEASRQAAKAERSDDAKFALRLLNEYRLEFPRAYIPKQAELEAMSDEDLATEVARARAGPGNPISAEMIKQFVLSLATAAEKVAAMSQSGVNLRGYRAQLDGSPSLVDSCKAMACEMRARTTAGLPWWLGLPAIMITTGAQVAWNNDLEERAQATLNRPVKRSIDPAKAEAAISAMAAADVLAVK